MDGQSTASNFRNQKTKKANVTEIQFQAQRYEPKDIEEYEWAFNCFPILL